MPQGKTTHVRYLIIAILFVLAIAARFLAHTSTVQLEIKGYSDGVNVMNVGVKDITITKDDSGVVLHAAYDDAVPYLYNVSLSAHFDKTVKVQ